MSTNPSSTVAAPSAEPRAAGGERIIIFDTTLRDGEQSPGISLNRQEKVEIAAQLARLGVDVIEAGFPIASPGDFEAVRAIARDVRGPVIELRGAFPHFPGAGAANASRFAYVPTGGSLGTPVRSGRSDPITPVPPTVAKYTGVTGRPLPVL